MTHRELWERLAAIDRPAVSHGTREAVDLLNAWITDQTGTGLTVDEYPADGQPGPWGIRRPRPWTLLSASISLDGAEVANAAEQPLLVASGSPAAQGRHLRLSVAPDPDAVLILPPCHDGDLRWTAPPPARAAITTVMPRSGPADGRLGRLELPDEFPYPVFVCGPEQHRTFCLRSVEHTASFQVEVDTSPIPLLAAHRTIGTNPDGLHLLVIAHSCHRAPNAIDNSSGLVVWAGMLAEIAAKPPTWGKVTFLCAPEITGTAAFLENRNVTYDAGLVLDMMTRRASASPGPALHVDLPPTYLRRGARIAVALDELCARWDLDETRTCFDAASDHLLLNDPRVAIPSVRLGYWPDPGNHTSMDITGTADPEPVAEWIRRGPDILDVLATAAIRASDHTTKGPPFEPRTWLEKIPASARTGVVRDVATLGHAATVHLAHLHFTGLRGDALLRALDRSRGQRTDHEAARRLLDHFGS